MADRALRITLALLPALALGLSVVVLLAGGITLHVGPIDVAVRHAARPFVAGVVIALLVMFVPWRRRAEDPARPLAFVRALDIAFATLCVAIAGTWFAYRVDACGGLDSYAYVSTARIMAEGRLRVPEPLAAELPFPQALAAAAPPGWLPEPRTGSILPEFAPGLPLLMAAFLRLFGEGAPFWVSPLFGIVAMFAAGAMALRLAGPAAAMLAAIAVAVQPIFTTQAIQPMSDVVASAWLLLATLALVFRCPWPVAAGVFAAFAIWTRPPLMLPCAVAILLPQAARTWRIRLSYATTVAIGVALLALLQWNLYGHPLHSGRGPAGELFKWDRVAGNLRIYAFWFTAMYTPIIYVGIAAALVARETRRTCAILVVMFLVEAAPYLSYLQFDTWETLRYWLPGLTLLLVVAAAGLAGLAHRVLPGRALRAATVAFVWLLAIGAFLFLRDKPTFNLWASEGRFRTVGRLVALHSSPRDVVLADVHSGSLRLYSGRPTLRWEAIPPVALEPTVRALARHGRRTLVVIDDWVEERRFRELFAESLERLTVNAEWRLRGVTALSLSPRSETRQP